MVNLFGVLKVMGRYGLLFVGVVGVVKMVDEYIIDLVFLIVELRKEMFSMFMDENKEVVRYFKICKVMFFSEIFKIFCVMGFSCNLGMNIFDK